MCHQNVCHQTLCYQTVYYQTKVPPVKLVLVEYGEGQGYRIEGFLVFLHIFLFI